MSDYRLPQGDVFSSPHSDQWHWDVANSGLTMLSEIGSNLHGIAVGGDDRDLQGVCVEPREVMLGLRDFRLYTRRLELAGCCSFP